MVANVSTIITTSQLSSSSCCLQTTSSDSSVHIEHIDMGSATSLGMNTHQMAKDASPSSLGDAPAHENAANNHNNHEHTAHIAAHSDHAMVDTAHRDCTHAAALLSKSDEFCPYDTTAIVYGAPLFESEHQRRPDPSSDNKQYTAQHDRAPQQRRVRIR